jgi:hypothetical protein
MVCHLLSIITFASAHLIFRPTIPLEFYNWKLLYNTFDKPPFCCPLAKNKGEMKPIGREIRRIELSRAKTIMCLMKGFVNKLNFSNEEKRFC